MKNFANAHVHVKANDINSAKSFLDELVRIGVTHIGLHGLTEMFGTPRNLATLYWKKNYKKLDIFAFGSLHLTDIYKDIPLEAQAEKLLEMGFDGIKLIDMKPTVRKASGRGINHPCYDKMFDMLEEREIPVLMHVNDPEEFWDADKINPDFIKRGWFYGDGTYPSYQDIYNETFAVLDRHKNLNVILAHFFFLGNNLDEARRVLDTYPKVRFDLTPYRDLYLKISDAPEKWHDFFEEYSDRILFGTDGADNSTETEGLHNLVNYCLTRNTDEYEMPTKPGYKNRGIYLSKDAYQKIIFGNFQKFMGEKPKPVNEEMLKKAIIKMTDDFKKDGSFPEYVFYLEELLKK